ncbi:MAG: pyridoxal-dependent decarboxylase, exosortase A system-associated [Gammaproteobacteria bacterium]|nr:pyridoxal-dependent decarboxylase, exosortase A system-associated [Gammaproteobacteria bacterium]
MRQFAILDGNLQVAGIPLPRLAAQIGRTPFYAYDRGLLTQRIAQLRAILPHSVKLHYAIKANPMPAVVGHLAKLVDGLDVASGAELTMALNTGVAAREISFAGPGKQHAELRQALAAGVLINVESLREIRELAPLSAELGLPARVAVRVNPGFELKLSGMKMGGGPKQFGIDAECVPDALAEIGHLGLAFEGFHIFSGSQNLRPEAICDAQNKALALACELAAFAPSPVRVLNLGGGFGIPYFPGDQALDLAPIGANLQTLASVAQARLPQAELTLELGRYLVGEAGIYVCRVVDIKISRGQTFIVVDGGLHHHLAASGNFGQIIRKNYPVLIGNRADQTGPLASVVGPLCTPLDLLADNLPLGHAQPGDFVVVLQSGAYGPSASPQRFLSHPECAEVLVGLARA